MQIGAAVLGVIVGAIVVYAVLRLLDRYTSNLGNANARWDRIIENGAKDRRAGESENGSPTRAELLDSPLIDQETKAWLRLGELYAKERHDGESEDLSLDTPTGGQKVADLSIALARAREERETERAKALRYFECIRTIELERDRWIELHHDEVAGHQKFQDLAMAEIKKLAYRLERVQFLVGQQPPFGSQEQVKLWAEKVRAAAIPDVAPVLEQAARDYRTAFDPKSGLETKIERSPGQESVEAPENSGPTVT